MMKRSFRNSEILLRCRTFEEEDLQKERAKRESCVGTFERADSVTMHNKLGISSRCVVIGARENWNTAKDEPVFCFYYNSHVSASVKTIQSVSRGI